MLSCSDGRRGCLVRSRSCQFRALSCSACCALPAVTQWLDGSRTGRTTEADLRMSGVASANLALMLVSTRVRHSVATRRRWIDRLHLFVADANKILCLPLDGASRRWLRDGKGHTERLSAKVNPLVPLFGAQVDECPIFHRAFGHDEPLDLVSRIGNLASRQNEKELDNVVQAWGSLMGKLSEVAGLTDEQNQLIRSRLVPPAAAVSVPERSFGNHLGRLTDNRRRATRSILRSSAVGATSRPPRQ